MVTSHLGWSFVTLAIWLAFKYVSNNDVKLETPFKHVMCMLQNLSSLQSILLDLVKLDITCTMIGWTGVNLDITSNMCK